MVKVDDNGSVHVELANNSGSMEMDPKWLEIVPSATGLYNKFQKLKSKLGDLMVEASYEGDLYLVSEMINIHKVSVDSVLQAKGGMTALHMACRSGHIDIINLLLERGADLEKPDDRGRRAIHFAVKGFASF